MEDPISPEMWKLIDNFLASVVILKEGEKP